MAQSPQRHDGQPALACLKAHIGAIQMKPQRRVESQPRIAPHDQQQLVERRDLGRQLGPVTKRSAAIDDPAGARNGERTARLRRRNDLAHAVYARDADRPKPPPGLAELPGQTLLPALRQHDVLVHTDNPVVFGSFEASDSGRRPRWGSS